MPASGLVLACPAASRIINVSAGSSIDHSCGKQRSASDCQVANYTFLKAVNFDQISSNTLLKGIAVVVAFFCFCRIAEGGFIPKSHGEH